MGNIKHQKKKSWQQASRSRLRFRNLQSHFYEIKQKMNEISNTALSTLLKESGMSQIQSDLIQQIFAAAKLKNPNNRHYSESWMMLCLLFQIR